MRLKGRFSHRGRSAYKFICKDQHKLGTVYYSVVTDSLDYAVVFLEENFKVEILSIDLLLDSEGTIILPPWDMRKKED